MTTMALAESNFIEYDGESSCIRKLSGNEYWFAKHDKDEYKVLTNSTIVYSKLDFNTEQLVIQQAVDKWRKTHPLLNANITFNADRSEAHFVNLHRDYNYANISYLTLRNKDSQHIEMNSEEEDFVFKLLIQREASISIDTSSEILWRLVFFKYSNSPDANGRFKYSIFLSVHHTITDLKNQFDNFVGKIKLKSFMNLFKAN
jgi:hypothetical protein